MEKIQIKSEKLTPFGGIFSIMEQFDSTLSSVIDSTLGIRCRLYWLSIQRNHPFSHEYRKHPTPMTIQLHPQCLLGIQGIIAQIMMLYLHTIVKPKIDILDDNGILGRSWR